MTKIKEIYLCKICGNTVEVLANGEGTLTCCNEPMEKLSEKTEDTGNEKHVPIIEKKDNGYLVKVGSVEHPMEEKHYIVFIELIADNHEYRKYLKPGEKPEAFFEVNANKVSAREFCNVHGLWKSK